MPANVPDIEEKRGFFGWIERVGNKIPNPVYLFLWLLIITAIFSMILSYLDVSAINPTTKEEVKVVNILTSTGIAKFLMNMHKEFVAFPPLATVFVGTLGLGVANRSGFLSSILKLAGLFKSKTMTTLVVFLIGICGNLVGDAAFVIYPPLVAILFKNTGRNPIAGLFAAYASVCCGFGANLVIGAADASLAGMTEAGAQIINPEFVTSPAMGYYFLLASTLFLAPMGTWLHLKYVEPKLDKAGLGRQNNNNTQKDSEFNPIPTEMELKGLKKAGISVLVFVAVVVLMTLPGMPFAAPEGGTVVTGALLKSIVAMIFFLFYIPGYVYGKTVGSINNFNDTIGMMTNEIKTLAGFFVISFFAAQFLAIFRDSNIGLIVAISGGNFLNNAGLQGPWLLALFVVLVAFINLFIGSANAKWAILSTIFVPMLMLAGVNPAATQSAYRMGDSLTNNISPMFPYMAIILGYAQEYDYRAKFGTVVSYMLPYTLWLGVVWIAFLIIWMFIGLPFGPGFSGLM
ncbi:MAG: AbgT family transporter [Tepidanaerobacteraceae bacterium]|nr:AbgT family transporter [Tepidanaerobacteraceae bacterium]